jgi:3'-phosphoadenosine 5'-phosphosulfate sulfotransferase (PAPS reductase)/FAD synthetase
MDRAETKPVGGPMGAERRGANPYLITGPALISFSGGRTSAFMLHQIIDAHGGALPDDVVVAFANTGLEREETLRFVHECGVRWNVRIHWLEYRLTGFNEVGFNSASREGEPFIALVKKKSYTPNGVTRFCTSELKIRVMRDFCRSLGWKNWTNIIGLRYDEGPRVLKALARNDSGKDPWRNFMPMARAAVSVTKRDVMRFWLGDNADPILLTHALPQRFDLGLRDYEGNCTLCMLKSRAKKVALIREHPEFVAVWKQMEVIGKGRFVTEYSYADLEREAREQPVMPGLLDDEEYDAECGLTCAGEAA